MLWKGTVFLHGFLVCLGGAAMPGPTCHLQNPELQAYSKEGDVIFGALSPAHLETLYPATPFMEAPAPRLCNKFYVQRYQCTLAMVFATEEININHHLLPNITLGFRIYNPCYSEVSGVEGALWLLSSLRKMVPNYSCSAKPKLAAILGDSPSASSVPVARILGISRFPQISHGSALPSLSNKLEFPSFLRTIPSVDSQPNCLIQLCKHFGWTWIGILTSDNDYGIQGGQRLKKEASDHGICIDFFITVPARPTQKTIHGLVELIRTSTVKVILFYAFPTDVISILEEVASRNITDKLWVAIECWLPSPVFSRKPLWKILNGTVGVTFNSRDVPGLKDFFNEVHPSKYPDDIFMTSFWEYIFSCQWMGGKVNTSVPLASDGARLCTGQEQLKSLDNSDYDLSNFLFVYAAYNAVYALAHALHNMTTCLPGKGPFAGGKCTTLQDFKPWQLFHYLKNVRFKNTVGKEVFFNQNGDIPGFAIVLNWHLSANGTASYVRVGTFVSGGSNIPELEMNDRAIQWSEQYTQVPRSVCSESCPTGYRKSTQEGKPSCCYDCVLCPDGMIANQTDAVDCLPCPEDTWPNEQRDNCILKDIEFLSYEDPLGFTLAFIAVFFSFAPVSVLLLFLYHQKTPVVKANNRGLSYLLLLSLTLCFLCSLMFIGYPMQVTCMLQQVIFGVTFTLCISCILAKTVTVVIAFSATNPNSRVRKWVGTEVAYSIVSTCSSVQVTLGVVWLATAPPFPQRNHSTNGKIIIECNESASFFFYCILAFMGLLALISFIVAFLARKLPDSFNEATFITFSMLVFVSVWLSFIPAYLSTKGKFMVAVEIFAILFSSAGLFCCIFLPKCYNIVLRPNMNTREYLTSKPYSKYNIK